MKSYQKKHHAGKFIFFGGTTNHAHLIWEFLMRMPIIYNLFKGQDYRLVVTKDSKNLVQRWFDLLDYPKDNLYFFDGDKVNFFRRNYCNNLSVWKFPKRLVFSVSGILI